MHNQGTMFITSNANLDILSLASKLLKKKDSQILIIITIYDYKPEYVLYRGRPAIRKYSFSDLKYSRSSSGDEKVFGC